jgi:ankyrin repeat protein
MSLKKFIVLPLAWGYKLHFGAANLGAENETTPLMIAVEQGDKYKVIKILEGLKTQYLQNPDNTESQVQYERELGKRDHNSMTALSFALKKPDIGIATILIKAKADVNEPLSDRYRKTHLMYACLHGQVDVVKLLLENRALPDLRDKDDNSALSFALMNSGDTRFEVGKMLLLNGADVNGRHSEPVDQYVDDGPYVDCNQSYLFNACCEKDVEAVKFLLSLKASPDSSALNYVLRSSMASGGNLDAVIEIMNLLIDFGADVNATDEASDLSASELVIQSENPGLISAFQDAVQKKFRKAVG